MHLCFRVMPLHHEMLLLDHHGKHLYCRVMPLLLYHHEMILLYHYGKHLCCRVILPLLYHHEMLLLFLSFPLEKVVPRRALTASLLVWVASVVASVVASY